MEDVSIGLYATIITVLVGIIPGLWALVRQYRKDVTDAEKNEADAAKVIIDASASLVTLYQNLAAKQEEDKEESRERSEAQSAQISALVKSQEMIRNELAKTLQELIATRKSLEDTQRSNAELMEANAGLTLRINELEVGVEKLSEQIRSLGQTPAWTSKRSKKSIEVE